MFKQVLPTSTEQNVWRPVRRICIMMTGLKGLILKEKYYFVSYNSRLIVLVISNRPRATCSADFKLLARLPPELYSTQSNYHYLLHDNTNNCGFIERDLLPVHLFLHLFSSGQLFSSRDKIFVQRETQSRHLILLTLIKHKQNKKTQQQIERIG